MKFKVGDKVRVTGNDCAYQKGYVGIITRDDNDGTYQLDKKRLWIGYPKIEPVTPLTFDHEKALQGSPVYLDGKRIYPIWLPNSQRYSDNAILWNDKGCFTQGYDHIVNNLTTIPPVEYVEESRWVWVRENGMTSMAYELKDVAEYQKPKYDLWQLCEVKVKK